MMEGRRAGGQRVGCALKAGARAVGLEPSGAGSEPPSWANLAMPEVTHRLIEMNSIRLHMAGWAGWYPAVEVRSEQKLSNPRSERDREGRSR
jgi:hypothetical protein